MKKRIIYLFITLIVMLLGLASRKYMSLFPSSIAPYIGDALWAMMVYFGFRFLLPNQSTFKSLLLAFIFSFGIESSQLYQADWINEIRSTTLGGLILGYGFLYQDLISYTIGILLAALLEWMPTSLSVPSSLNKNSKD